MVVDQNMNPYLPMMIVFNIRYSRLIFFNIYIHLLSSTYDSCFVALDDPWVVNQINSSCERSCLSCQTQMTLASTHYLSSCPQCSGCSDIQNVGQVRHTFAECIHEPHMTRLLIVKTVLEPEFVDRCPALCPLQCIP